MPDEAIEQYLTQTLDAAGLNSAMRIDDNEVEETVETLSEGTLADFFPEKSFIAGGTDWQYACSFVGADGEGYGVYGQDFADPSSSTLLHMLVRWYVGFGSEGGNLVQEGELEVDFCGGRFARITRIPLSIVSRIISESVVRTNGLYASYSDPIRKYYDREVVPRLSDRAFSDEGDDEE